MAQLNGVCEDGRFNDGFFLDLIFEACDGALAAAASAASGAVGVDDDPEGAGAAGGATGGAAEADDGGGGGGKKRRRSTGRWTTPCSTVTRNSGTSSPRGGRRT
jgi:hypothetical protein